jgi:hypothetical protein
MSTEKAALTLYDILDARWFQLKAEHFTFKRPIIH